MQKELPICSRMYKLMHIQWDITLKKFNRYTVTIVTEITAVDDEQSTEQAPDPCPAASPVFSGACRTIAEFGRIEKPTGPVLRLRKIQKLENQFYFFIFY